jgi:hypothetical protein
MRVLVVGAGCSRNRQEWFDECQGNCIVEGQSRARILVPMKLIFQPQNPSVIQRSIKAKKHVFMPPLPRLELGGIVVLHLVDKVDTLHVRLVLDLLQCCAYLFLHAIQPTSWICNPNRILGR